MPRSSRNQNQGGTSDRANRSARGPYSSSTAPFSANNQPQAPYFSINTPSTPDAANQRRLHVYNNLNEPTTMIPTWNVSVDMPYEAHSLAAQQLRQEQPNNGRQSSSPMLKRVRKMRVAEQQRVDAQLEAGSKVDSIMKSETRVAAICGLNPSAKVEIDVGVSPTNKKAIPELELPDQDWAAPLYTLANDPEANSPAQTTGMNKGPGLRQQSIMATDKSADSSDDDVDALVRAIANMHPFQQIACSPSKPRAIWQESVAPAEPKQGKIQTALDGDYEEVHKEPSSTTKSVNERDKKVEEEHMAVALNRSSRSVNSFASAASDDFKRVKALNSKQTEQNRVKRKWFKAYRR